MNGTGSSEKLCLKNIYELLGETFFIPAYQRGYRWSSIQVRELLDDIWEFSQKESSKKSAFYCLQPVVVVQRDTHWEVVDGQQRLTTIHIILRYLETKHLRRNLSDAYKKALFSIRYETRPESQSFLEDIQSSSETENIDFFHIAKAYEAVEKWFDEKDYNDNNELLATLLAKPDASQSVKVIWYDLSDECIGNDYAVDVFSRINIGKIPLTNAELVKALFLQSIHFHEIQASLKQIQIASEWDQIERQLQEPDFWHFIYSPDPNKQYETRIEFIFDLMKGKKPGDETFFTFHQFNGDFKGGGTDIDELWKSVKDYFLTFDQWFRDRDLYHLIGFIVCCGGSVATLKKQSELEGRTKTDFKKYLKDEIRSKVNCQLDELRYGDTEIKKVLLLFNIQTLLSSTEADVRFPFDRYKRECWDIEHIRSQTDMVLNGKDRHAWLEDIQAYFNKSYISDFPDETQEIVDEVGRLLSQSGIDSDTFNSLYQRVLEDFNEGAEDWVDDLGNLALLDAGTNRSYRNALFPVKRARIIQNDMQGIFVPICTKNAFLKFYSRSSRDLIYWSANDAKDYAAAIAEILREYLPDQGSNDE